MTETEKAWIGGYFDGEGFIVLSCHGRENRHIALQVGIGNNRPHAIRWIHSYYGGRITCTKNASSPNISTRLHLYGEKAVFFLKDVLPYLRDKKRRALLAIAFQRYKTTTKTRGGYGNKLTKEVIEHRDQFRRAIKRLNHTQYDAQFYKNTGRLSKSNVAE